MTAPDKAPERIWAKTDARPDEIENWYVTEPWDGMTPYIRADVAGAMVAGACEAAAGKCDDVGRDCAMAALNDEARVARNLRDTIRTLTPSDARAALAEAERKAWNAALDAARALVGPHLPGIRAVQITALKKGPGEAIAAFKKETQG